MVRGGAGLYPVVGPGATPGTKAGIALGTAPAGNDLGTPPGISPGPYTGPIPGGGGGILNSARAAPIEDKDAMNIMTMFTYTVRIRLFIIPLYTTNAAAVSAAVLPKFGAICKVLAKLIGSAIDD